MLHVHHADPDDDDPMTWDAVQGEIPGLLPADVRDPIDLLRLENENLRAQLLQVRITLAQLGAAYNRLQSIVSEGA